METIWTRRLFKNGTADALILPPQLQRFLEVRRGDFLHLQYLGGGVCQITKANLAAMPDRVAEAAMPLPTIHG